MKVGVIGGGIVGSATAKLSSSACPVLVYDIISERCVPAGVSLDDICTCELAFVCVPTPSNADGSTNLEAVKQAIEALRTRDYAGGIVVRSTVPVGTCDGLAVFHMPEFLTAKNWARDIARTQQWIVGVPSSPLQAVCEHLSTLVREGVREGRLESSNIIFCTNSEAESVKYFRNTFLAVKVSFCNEIAHFCSATGINYEKVRALTVQDSRIDASHTSVPGPDGLCGFGGMCFPKDCLSLISQMGNVDVRCPILRSAVQRNATDRNREKATEPEIL